MKTGMEINNKIYDDGVLNNLWVDTYLNIQEFLSQHWRSVINWVTGSIESSTKHFNTHWHSKYITSELASSGHVIDIGGTLENLKKKKHE